MNYHEIIRALIGSLVGGRYYPNRFPQESADPTWPAMRGTIVSRSNAADQCGAGELSEEEVQVQIDIFARTYGECVALLASVSTALGAAASPWIRQPGGFEGFDEEAKVHRITRDWVLHQSSQ